MKALRRLASVLVVAMWATAAHGDGGTMLLHQDAGAFTVTLFAAPQPLEVGTADFSVMVQDRSTGEVLLDPAIDLTIAGTTVRLGRGQVSNRLLQSAGVHLHSPGKQHLRLEIKRGRAKAQLDTEVTVERGRSRADLVWFYILLPIAIILLFVIHQGLKLRSERKAK
jgi:hypothetical protein